MGCLSFTVPRTTADSDTSQADDFRTRGVPWTIKRTLLERGRACGATTRVWRSGAWARWQDVATAQDCGGAAAVARRRPGDRLARAGRHGGDAYRLARRFPGRRRPGRASSATG